MKAKYSPTALLLIMLFVSIGLNSCVKDKFDLKEKFSGDFQWNPELALPIAHGNLTLADLVKEKQDTIQYISENDLGYGSENEDFVIQLRYAIDTGRSIDVTRLPIMDPYDTTLYLPSIELNDIVAPLAKSFNTLLQDNFSASDLADYQAYEAASPTNVTEHISNNTFRYTADIPIPAIDYIIVSEGQMKVTLVNNLGVDVTCELAVLTDSLGTDIEVAVFDFSTITPSGGSQADSVSFSTTYLGSTLKYEYRNLTFKSAPNASIDLSNLLVAQIGVTDITASEGRAMVPQQTIKVDSLIFVGVRDQDPTKSLYNVMIERGAINYTITSSIDVATDFEVGFPSMTVNGNPVSKSASLNVSNPVVSSDWDLANHELDLTSNPDQAGNSMPIRLSYEVYTGNNKVNFGPNQNINLRFTNTDSIVFSYLEGNFGKMTEDVFTDTLDFNIESFISNFLSGEITFYDPKLRIIYDNPVGIDGEFELNLKGRNSKGDEVDVFAGHNNSFSIKAPDCDSVKQGLGVVSTIELNKQTSNIVDFIKLLPSQIEYSGKYHINKNAVDESAIVNCVSNKGDARLTVEAELPMKLSVKNLVLQQEIVLSEIPNFDNIENIEKLRLYFYTENMFPLDVKLKISMLDTTTAIPTNLGVLDMYLLEAANTVNGKVPRNGYINKHTAELELESATDNRLEKLLQANKLLVEVFLETDQQGNVPVIFYTYYGLKFNLALEGKFLYNGRVDLK